MLLRQCPLFFLFLFLCCGLSAFSQTNNRKTAERCATMLRLERLMERDPSLRKTFETQRQAFARTLAAGSLLQQKNFRTEATVSIPVVFHIVMTNPSRVTDAQIQAQLDTLNKDFFGTNGDSVRIPSYFKPLFGKSKIQFCLAQRTPDGEPSTGIVRTVTSRSSFTYSDSYDTVKHAETGGDDSWNTNDYFNVWVCALSDNVLGYATFPNFRSPQEQGVVIDYASLPGGSATNYNKGKTLTHETGHFFNLYHIWGDDGGGCYGSDDVDDTPNQADATAGCFTGRKTDACTTSGDGIMYQNYMDYSYDNCLVMFTNDQVTRMEAALSLYRSSLLASNGCQSAIRRVHDAQLKSIGNPLLRVCTASFVPVVTIRNAGSQTLTSLSVNAQIDNGPISVTNWTGSLPTAAAAIVSLTGLTTTSGIHVLTVYVTNPNAVADEETSNDTLRTTFQYNAPVETVKESFEGTTFPPPGWDVLNPDGFLTWERATGVSKSGNASVVIRNFDYSGIGEQDDLRMPQIGIPATADSAFLSFQVAAAVVTATSAQGNNWDTLQVLVSTDCGQSYTSVYKKWGASLITRKGTETSAFVPTASEWRKDSINLAPYIGLSNLLVLFRNTTGNENNVYLDDINLRTVIVNPNLKASGFLVTPSPTNGTIAVQFYPQPTGLQGIQLFSSNGQKLTEIIVSNGQASNLYNFDLSRYAPGVYMVRAVFADKVITKKITRL